MVFSGVTRGLDSDRETSAGHLEPGTGPVGRIVDAGGPLPRPLGRGATQSGGEGPYLRALRSGATLRRRCTYPRTTREPGDRSVAEARNLRVGDPRYARGRSSGPGDGGDRQGPRSAPTEEPHSD